MAEGLSGASGPEQIAWPEMRVDDIKSAEKSSIAIGPFGSRMKSTAYVASGVPVIRGMNISDGLGFDGDFVFIPSELADDLRTSNVVADDLIFPHRGAIGSVGLVPAGGPERWMLSSSLMKLTCDRELADPRFIFYFFRSQLGRNELLRHSSNVGTPGIVQPLTSLRSISLKLPPLHTQRRIADVLHAMDNLIENNRRRIEVLEEIAQAIYREWFVHFRFPGHENTTFVDSPLGPIPEGWEIHPLSHLATVVRGRSYRKYELAEEVGLPFVNLKCMMRGGGFRMDGLKRYTGDYKPQQLVSYGDIVLAVTDLTQGREILAQATLVPRMAEEVGVISLDVARIVPVDVNNRLPLFFSLRSSDFADRVKEYANGSTVLHLSPKFVEQNELVWPGLSLRSAFTDVVKPMVASLEELRESAERLAAIRDLLLPKLVTGEIDVSDLDLDGLVGAAS